MFRQSSELWLIWLHDIPHILHQAQRPLLALVLTSLSSDALALTPPWLRWLALRTNSLTKFTSSLPTHASCRMYLFLSLCLALSCLVSSCLILPISCPCYPYLSLSPLHTSSLLPFSVCLTLLFLPLFIPPLWRSGTMQSQRARPCLITLIKHPVR